MERLTGKPLGGEDWVEELEQDLGALITSEKVAYEEAAGTSTSEAGKDVELDMRIRIVDGDVVIADTASDGGFLATCAKFEKYIAARFRT